MAQRSTILKTEQVRCARGFVQQHTDSSPLEVTSGCHMCHVMCVGHVTCAGHVYDMCVSCESRDVLCVTCTSHVLLSHVHTTFTPGF